MAHRDFAARQRGGKKTRKSKKSNKNLLILIALVVVVVFAAALFLLRSKTPEPVATTPAPVEKPQPKSQLPNRPEEVWSYIKALETRTVPVDDNQNSVEKNMRLTQEQRQVLLEMEKEQKAQEAKRIEAAAAAAKAENAKVESVPPAPSAPTAAPQPAPKVETVKKAEVKVEPKKEAKPEAPKVEAVKTETAKTEAKKPEAKADSSGKKFGLQCGAFKNRAQAESLQGRLAMVGVNAQIASSDDWNRVRVGPFGSRDQAVSAQEKAKAVIGCVVIGM